MQKLKAIFTVFISLYCLTIKAQTAEQTFQKADSLMELKQFKTAELLLERLTYFSDSSNYLKIYLKAGDCYAALEEYSLAADHYRIAARYTESERAENEVLFLAIQMHTLLKDGIAALKLLDELYDLDSNEQKRFYFYTAVNYMLVNRQDSSIEYFTKLARLAGMADTDEFKAIVKKHKKVHKPKPHKAKALSYLLPGAGQMYSGDVKNSLNSLLINGIFITLFYNTAVVYTLADAIIGVSGWTFRYYRGGAIGAYHIAQEKQNKKKDKVLQQYINLFASSGL